MGRGMRSHWFFLGYGLVSLVAFLLVSNAATADEAARTILEHTGIARRSAVANVYGN